MIAISRAMIRQYLVAARKCQSRRTRGPDRDVVIRQQGGKLTFTTAYDEVVLQFGFPAPSAEESLVVVPMSVLDQFQQVKGDPLQQVKDDPIELHCPANLKGEACWMEGSTRRSSNVQFIAPGQQHETLPLPAHFSAMPESFLQSLHECGRSTADHSVRFECTRIQVRGQDGQLIGTDTKIALVCSGFKFPFEENLLIPALPLFGLPALHAQDVRIGRTETHVAISADHWTVWLKIITGRYPDVANLVPRFPPTIARIDPLDATTLLNELPGLPGEKDEDQPVSLDLKEQVTVCGQDNERKSVKELVLRRSVVEGTHVRVTLNRKQLARAMSLGCHTLKVSPEKPLVIEGDNKFVLMVALETKLIRSTKNDSRLPKPPIPQPLHPPERNTGMNSHESNGRMPNGRPEPQPPTDTTDPLVVVEELRAALLEASTKATKLATLLKSGRREKKVLANVFAGLKQLNLE